MIKCVTCTINESFKEKYHDMMMLNGSSHATATTGQSITHIRLTVMLKVATSSLAQGYPVS